MLFLYVIITLFICLNLISLLLLSRAVHPKTIPLQTDFLQQLEKGTVSQQEFNQWQKIPFTVQSDFGYALSGLCFPISQSHKTIILTHGFTSTKFGMLKYVPLFRDLGFNVVIYDNRYHGESGGKNTTFGFFEKLDLKKIVDWVFAELRDQIQVGTMGESLGAAITLQHAAIDKRIDFAIADSSFSNLPDLFRYRMRYDFRLPGWITLPLASFWSRILHGFSFYSVNIVKMLSNGNPLPILLIHGAVDKYVPPTMSETIFQSIGTSAKKLEFFPDARHAQSINAHPQDYAKTVKEFLENFVG